MSRSARSVFVFGIYLAVLGAILVVVPNLFLAVFRFPATSEAWIRVVGVLFVCLAYYYIQTARMELSPFFELTVYARSLVIVFFLTFVALRLARPTLLVLGAIDLGAALWTRAALRAEGDG